MQYTEKELARLIEDVEKEFSAHLTLGKSEKESTSPALAKAEDEKPKEEKEEEEKPAPEAKEGEEKPEEHKEQPEGEHKEAAPAESEHKEGEEGHDYDDEDLKHLHSMYMSMGKGELKVHHDAVKNALDSHGLEKRGDMQMGKSEKDVIVEVKPEAVAQPNQEVALLKSELDAQKAKSDELKKSLDAVQEFLTKLVKKTAPQGKAITSLDAIAKSEGAEEEKALTKGEIDSILNKKSADPSLKKSDRDAINAYYLNGASINSISHLLK